MNLIIVESPTKARTLSRFLGKNYTVEATMGHIKDLPKSKLGVDLKNDFAPDYVLIPKREETIQKLKQISRKAKKVYLATDPDREGEAIAAHVREVIHLKPSAANRIVFHEITQEAVTAALTHPGEINRHLVDAQISRRVLDRLVGYNLSPLLWRKVRRGLSAGRVQTVTLRLIVEREREIKLFKPAEFWEIFVDLKTNKKQELRVQLVKAEIDNRAKAEEVTQALEKASYLVEAVQKREIVRNPYPPFTTSTLSQAGARLFGWTAKRTMSVAQRLYEEGLITYHRTDSTSLAIQAIEAVRKHILKVFGSDYLPEKPWFYKTTARVAQEAHEAIRPTQVSKDRIEATKHREEAVRLYDLIWKRFTASQMTASRYDETTVEVKATTEKKPTQEYYLRASGQILRFPGWRRLFASSAGEVILPEVKAGELLHLVKVESMQKFTQPPPRYTEASLIKTLEKLGIGRPSTYAPTISVIQIRNYVEKENGAFLPTTIGIAVNDFLVKYFPEVFDYAFTAQMEADLDEVAVGKKPWVKTMAVFWKPFSAKLKEVAEKSKRVKIETEKLNRQCPECQKGGLVVRLGRFGKFISCSRFPDCKYTERFVEKTGKKCPECRKGNVVVKKSAKGRKFYGCSRYPDCHWASWRLPAPKGEEKKDDQATP